MFLLISNTFELELLFLGKKSVAYTLVFMVIKMFRFCLVCTVVIIFGS